MWKLQLRTVQFCKRKELTHLNISAVTKLCNEEDGQMPNKKATICIGLINVKVQLDLIFTYFRINLRKINQKQKTLKTNNFLI